MKTNPSTYLLLTGASTGLGRAMALECARRGMNLILVALPGERLERLALQIRKAYGVEVVFIETDLASEGAVEELADYVSARFPLFGLINNAGVGGTTSIFHTSAQNIDRMLQVNVRSSALLTYRLLPELMKQPRGYILNVSSMAAFSPMAYKLVYPASKAFVHSFSRSLREELRPTSVSVSVVNPGPILTSYNISRRALSQGFLGRLCLVSPSRIARMAVEGMLKGEAVIVPGWANRLNLLLMQLVPEGLRTHFASRIAARELGIS